MFLFPADYTRPDSIGRRSTFTYRDVATGEMVRDACKRFTVAIPEERLGDLRGLLRAACVLFGQKCIYLSVAGYVEFVEPI